MPATIPDLRISEIMYHPPAAPPGSPFGDEEFEFLELRNVGTETPHLGRVKLSGGISYEFLRTPASFGPGKPRPRTKPRCLRQPLRIRRPSGRSPRGTLGKLRRSSRPDRTTGRADLGFQLRRCLAARPRWPRLLLTIRRPAAPSSEWNRSDAWDRSVIGGARPDATTSRNPIPTRLPSLVHGDGGSVVRLQFEIPPTNLFDPIPPPGLSGILLADSDQSPAAHIGRPAPGGSLRRRRQQSDLPRRRPAQF